MKYFFVSGPHAVGKSYTMNQVAKDLNVTLYDTGPIMREYHLQLAPNKTMSEWVSELEAKNGKKVTAFMLAKKLKEKMKQDNSSQAIIVGFRTLEGIAQLMEIMKSGDFGVMFVDGSMDLLYENYNNRLQQTTNQRKDLKKTYPEFQQYIENEFASGLADIRDFTLAGFPMSFYYKKDVNDNDLYYLVSYIIEQTKEIPKTNDDEKPPEFYSFSQ